jgi:lipopolysaccharide transport system permease protein
LAHFIIVNAAGLDIVGVPLRRPSTIQILLSSRRYFRQVHLLLQRYLGDRFVPLQTKLSLLAALVQRDLEAKYKGSILGNLWPLLTQLSQLLIYTYVFSIVLRVKLDLAGIPSNNFTFGLWLFAGLVPWLAFTNGLIAATTSVITQPNLIKRVVFPLELLPLVPVLSAFIESLLGMAALVIIVAIVTSQLHATLFLLPLVWITQLLLTAGLGYLMAGLTVFLRDVPQTLGVILNIWFYLTPIVYPAESIPDFLRSFVFWVNPLSALAQVYRDLILVGSLEHGGQWAIASVSAIVIFLGGYFTYNKLKSGFADVI